MFLLFFVGHLTSALNWAKRLFRHPLFYLKFSPMLVYLMEINQISVTMGREKYRNGKYRNYILMKCALYGWSILFPFRAFYICYLQKNGLIDQLQEHQSTDPVMSVAVLYYRFFDHYATMLVCSFPTIFALYVDYAITVLTDHYSITQLYYIIVVNAEDFVEHNIAHFDECQIDLLKPIRSCKNVVKLLHTLWSGENVKFKVDPLPHFETHPPVIRARHLVMTEVLDMLFALVNVCMSK